MENSIFHVPVGMAGSNTIFIDGIFPDAPSITLTRRDVPDLSNQSHIMAACPAVSLLQGEPLGNLHTSLHSSNQLEIVNSEALIPRSTQFGRDAIVNSSTVTACSISNSEVQDQFMAGIPISSASLGTLLAAGCIPLENLSNLEASATLCYPGDIQKSLASSIFADAFTSSLQTHVNYDCDGLFGGMKSSKWDFSKFLAPAEFAGTISGSAEFQPFQSTGNMDASVLITSENAMSSGNSGSASFSNELSLSLATNPLSVVRGTTIPDHCSEISSAVVSSHSFIDRQLCSEQTSCKSRNLSLGFGSHNSVWISHLLSGSRYLNAMQEIFAEIASYSLENVDQVSYPASGMGAVTRVTFSPDALAQRGNSGMHFDDSADEDGRFMIQMNPVLQGHEVEIKKKDLLALLQVVDDRYNHCLDEIHTVISAFHAVTELDPSIHGRFALQTISFLYKNLREKISSYILSVGLPSNKQGASAEDRSFETSFLQKQWALQQMRRRDHQLWRPQRGLPERSVSVLRAWMFQNFLHPYPKDAEKHLLAVKSGLTRSQVSNWFINARVRLWKPMIEEMYSEMNRRKSCRNSEAANSIC